MIQFHSLKLNELQYFASTNFAEAPVWCDIIFYFEEGEGQMNDDGWGRVLFSLSTRNSTTRNRKSFGTCLTD